MPRKKVRDPEHRPTVLSLFTGAGGMDLGFQAAKFKVVCAVEKERWACDTLRANHRDLLIVGPPDHTGDVKAISGDDLIDMLGGQQIDVVVGGPPCQPFSTAASQRFLKADPRFKRRGFEDETRGTLLFDFVRLVLALKPRAWVLENVPGILSIDGGDQLSAALGQLRDQGYAHSEPAALEAAAYGIPQFRKRVIIWGSSAKKSVKMPEPTHAAPGHLFLPPYLTAAQALLDIAPETPNHVTREHKSESLDRYRRLDFGERDQLGRADRLDPRQPSKTVIAGGLKGGGRSHLHPYVARTLSVRECARLQTFPDSFVLEGATARQFTQVGNAVPPLLAEKLARHIGQVEFGMTYRRRPTFEQHLRLDLDQEAAAEQLLLQARQERPEWLYHSEADSERPVQEDPAA